MSVLLLLAGCVGLTPMPTKDAGRNLDTGVFGDTGVPLDSAVDGNYRPIADAGADASAEVGRVATLDGTGSSDADGDPLEYAWVLATAPSGSAAELINEDQDAPQFIPDLDGRYVIELVVSDGALESAPDEVEITAATSNGAPVANAGTDQTVRVGADATLNGGNSTDPDGDVLQFTWTMTTRPSGSTTVLTSSTSATPRFNADVAGTYEISLTVSDGDATSAADSVRVTAAEEDSGGGSGCGCRSTGAGDTLFAALAGLALLFPKKRR